MKLKFYKIITLPFLLYGSEAWVVNKKGTTKTYSAEIIFFKIIKGCTRMERIRMTKYERNYKYTQ
jgi:hypothetical protein